MEIQMHKCGTLNLDKIAHKAPTVPRGRARERESGRERKKAATHTRHTLSPRTRSLATSHTHTHTLRYTLETAINCEFN